MSNIKFGIVGTGSMASTMMTAFNLHEKIEVIGVCSNNKLRAQAFAEKYNLPLASNELSAFLNNPEINAIYIANATEKHAEVSVAALEAGKSVLCEKPCAINEDQFHAIQTAAKHTGTLFMEGLWTLTLPSYQKLKQDIIAPPSNLGTPLSLTASFGYPAPPSAFPQLYKTGGGVIFDRLVYLLATSIQLFGEVESIKSEVIINDQGIDTECHTILRHKNGKRSILSASLNTYLPNNVDAAFSGGSLQLLPPSLGSETLVTTLAPPPTGPQQDALESREEKSLLNTLKRSPLLRQIKRKVSRLSGENLSYGQDQYLPQLNHFCDLVLNNQSESPLIPLSLSGQVINCASKIKSEHSKPQ